MLSGLPIERWQSRQYDKSLQLFHEIYAYPVSIEGMEECDRRVSVVVQWLDGYELPPQASLTKLRKRGK